MPSNRETLAWIQHVVLEGPSTPSGPSRVSVNVTVDGGFLANTEVHTLWYFAHVLPYG